MLLTIDIGNTNIKLGVFEGEQIRATWRMASNVNQMVDEDAAVLLNLLNFKDITPSEIDGVALCSVVPPLTTTFANLSQSYFHTEPLIVGAGVKTGVSIRMDNPREVGTDRIADAAAAHHLYEGPLVIIDLGTATTFGIVSEEGDYIGGIVATGIATAAEALFSKTAQLPRVELAHPKHVIGTNTVAAIRSGIIYGYASLVEGMIARIQEELGEKATVIATGGYARLIANETDIIDIVNPDLTLVGLRLIYRINKD